METGAALAVAVRKNALTPKAIVHQKFGVKACYKIEEVHESADNECPGLAILQKGPCMYRCSLQLPEIYVVSKIFKKKKEAEQHASELALEKLGIDPSGNPTEQDPWDALVGRIKFLFADEFLSSLHPLSGHLRAALQREGDLYGSVPISIIAILDAKVCNLSKAIDPKVELNPYLAISHVRKAAAQLSGIVVTSEDQHWIRRQNPYPLDVIESAIGESGSPGSFSIEAVYIPWSSEKAVDVVNLNVSSPGYYLDVIAKQLGLVEASEVLITRSIGKASSEARMYFAASQSCVLEPSADLGKKAMHLEGLYNARASYLSGEDVFGDAIFASIGYSWKSKDLWHEDLSKQSYYRMLLGKVPSGVYKLSRAAILTADLPLAFTTRTNWRGSIPRDILCAFCRQHRLSEPVFSIVSISEAPSEPSGSHKKLKVIDSAVEGTHCANGCAVSYGLEERAESGGMFRCEVKIYSRSQDLIIDCLPKESYKKHSDSIQKASLKVLLWLDAYFKNLDMPVERLECSAHELDIRFNPQSFSKAFEFCQSIRFFQHCDMQEGGSHDLNFMPGHRIFSVDIDGPVSGISPTNGSLSCISYSVTLVTESENTKELLESSDEFEFEIGSRSVISQLEAAVTQMTVGQSAFLRIDFPPQDFILAAADDSERILSLLSSKDCSLQYTITLIRVTEPLEDRMEQALFSPPLSKQRVEYALQHIKQSCATNLVDFGCGSGSLLDSLLNYQTSLEKIVGVDISHKSLVRAAKILHSKLNTNSDADVQTNDIKSAILYDGSITDFDSRLCGFDIGTCLEVIEHMEEDQAWLFGNIVLSYFRPKLLIVSTPNYEYNVILQRSSLSGQEEDPDDKTQSQSCKFRNHDHKFEWTREQFNHWATELAVKHNYSVEFSGVGGSGDTEPGFASQIAVFRRDTPHLAGDAMKVADSEHRFNIVWEWDRSNRS
ncbi:hypothetical protein TIFTF001_023794 [Ficus carica]|uniref:Small RNA 2'-O-methyltransferase n=1 Tax=Ficus carica TaxID=3494 RepID=A0AA88AK95_FICCA|nr:hypothetical protein TIFTF001_023794 [Ficus carica]